MKYIWSILFLSAFFGLILNGCESPTDSKAYSTAAPSLISPADRDTMVSLTPTFKWSGSADKINIATDQNFSSIIYSVPVTDSSSTYVMPSGILQAYTYYYWRAGQTSGSSVNWSETIYSFRTLGN